MLKSFLFATVAGIASVPLAMAADVPMEKAEAIEYVRICSDFGTGYFLIPGTDTCLQISGEAIADAYAKSVDVHGDTSTFYDWNGRNTIYGTDSAAGVDQLEFSVNGKIAFDARTDTEIGLLRSYVKLSYDTAANAGSAVVVDKAYIQIAGLTAGFAPSLFTFFDDYSGTIWADYYSTAPTLNSFQYTANFRGGYFASIGLESAQSRRNSVAASGFNVYDPNWGGDTAEIEETGSGYPDIVLAGGIAQTWGTARIMAAFHDNQASDADKADGLDGDWGYALGAGLVVNLPLATGGRLAVEALYADEALGYITRNAPDRVVNLAASAPYSSADVAGSTGWSVSASLQLPITAALQTNIFGSYGDIAYGVPASAATTDPADVLRGYTGYEVGANLIYTVVAGLTIGVEGSYKHQSFSVSNYASNGGLSGDFDNGSFQGGLRIRRTF